MANEQTSIPLRELFVMLEPRWRIVGPGGDAVVSGVSLWWSGAPLPNDVRHLVVIPPSLDVAAVRELLSLLNDPTPRALAVPENLIDALAAAEHHTYAVLPDDDFDPVELIGIVSKTFEARGRTSEQRLAALQRTLGLSLSAEHPVPDLIQRLKKICNAAIAFVDPRGRAVHTTGPIPLAMIFAEISLTNADSQRLFLEGGWRGVAARVSDPTEPEGLAGWLVAVSRQPDFPTSYDQSAVHLAATLVEIVQRMLTVARLQEEAVRSSVLDQAIALQPVRDDDELTRRIAGLGIAFDRNPRIATLRPRPRAASTNGTHQLRDLAATAQETLRAANIPALCSISTDRVVLLMQCSDKDLRRLLISHPDRYTGVTAGVGRPVANAGAIAASYNDALLALRLLRRRPRAILVMSYEDFDVAPRLFAEVGLERMREWAHDYLQPIAERPSLMDGLRSYFDNEQNINAAADALGIHHNSLRYRLTRIEELLEVSLKSPSTLASLFLAVTAVDLAAEADSAPRPSGRIPVEEQYAAVPTEFRPDLSPRGVVRGPDV